MPQTDLLILMAMGGLFILLGLGAVFWDKKEQRSYYDAISTWEDVREYMEHAPNRPELGALKIGGRIAVVLGLTLLVMGGIFWLWN
jgi:hypothetical protein